VRAFLLPYARALGEPPEAFAAGAPPLPYLDYDWRLNDVETR
jgi:hypothetical protein